MTAAQEVVASLRRALEARAVGWWVVRNGHLELLAFEPAPDLDTKVADAFRAATRSVLLEPSGLGIVRAAIDAEVIVSVAEVLPPDSGSGFWLRAFGAERSIAVPRLGPEGLADAVLSVALGSSETEDCWFSEVIQDILRSGTL